MAEYNVKSLKADEFINHEEILETLRYADEHKNDRALIEQILESARPRKTARGVECPGLSHRDASVLLACDDPELTEKMFALAREIKEAFYGDRIVMFAPLYLSNYCVNKCVYCPYHMQNKSIPRKKLTQDEVRDEVIALQDMGHKRLAIEAGEDPSTTRSSISSNVSKRSIRSSIRTVRSAVSMSTSPQRQSKIIRNCTMRASELISCFRRLTTRKVTKNSIPQDRSTIMLTTRKQWTELWKAALMMSVWAFCSDWNCTAMSSQVC
jgi:2-iminoacetate synthase ThiH